MIAVDTNLLVYAHRADSEWHTRALRRLVGLAESRAPWAIPWPCVHEFLAIVTHPRIYSPPSRVEAALASVAVWLTSAARVPIGEGPDYFAVLSRITAAAKAVGGMMHDARVAAICLHHGISSLWTADRDFRWFPDLETFNPLRGE